MGERTGYAIIPSSTALVQRSLSWRVSGEIMPPAAYLLPPLSFFTLSAYTCRSSNFRNFLLSRLLNASHR